MRPVTAVLFGASFVYAAFFVAVVFFVFSDERPPFSEVSPNSGADIGLGILAMAGLPIILALLAWIAWEAGKWK